ncbi:glycosyltransferase [Staphylotrichum tortipilum]|uniref:Glycosyltransferase n=1 Tax=Staphylotrichum tortipilum TaxID=2831512 RepID=A0AAN6RWL8_9PEZI|nr:glycosyltransferase [Staphylotrichum longicolle]
MAIQTEKPILVVATFNGPGGHTAGLLQISEHLVTRGFRIYFIAGPALKKRIEDMGAEFVEDPFRFGVGTKPLPKQIDGVWALVNYFGPSVPTAHRVLRETLERVRRDHPRRQVIILHGIMSGGLGPFVFGAPLPKGYSSLPKAINFHTTIYIPPDGTAPPFGSGLPYDPTPENRALWRALSTQKEPVMAEALDQFNKLYKALGATRPAEGPFLNLFQTYGDVSVMATSPSQEYPLATPTPRLRFIGVLPLTPLDDCGFVPPPWWSVITANAALPSRSPAKKKLVFVTQGSSHPNHNELLIPAIQSLAGRQGLIVVATLGARGAQLDGSIAVPDNAIVIDYFPYDVLLPYADVLISNGGYHGVMHCVMNGVPMVLAGTHGENIESSARAEWAGVAVNMSGKQLDRTAMAAAVDKVLADEGYKRRVMELKEENEAMNPLARMERIIDELTERE